MRRLACALACLLGISVLTQAIPSAQLSVVRGRVVAADDQAVPLRGARVTLAASTASADPVFTDANGRFAMGVPSPYVLRFTKGGYAAAAVRASGADAGVVRLVRGSAITGRVASMLGRPVDRAGVRARRLDPSPAEQQAGLLEFTAETNDRGEFRIGGLPAGRYAVHSEPPSIVHDAVHMFNTETDFFRLPALLNTVRPPTPASEPITVTIATGEETSVALGYTFAAASNPDAEIGGSITGAVVDAFGDPAEGLTVRAWRVLHRDGGPFARAQGVSRRTDDRGEFRLFHLPPGRYVVSAGDQDPRFAISYHPDTTAIANASVVIVRPRQETPGAHVRYTRETHARVSGTVRTSTGAFEGTVMLKPMRRPGAISIQMLTLAVDGRFEFFGVPPDDYMVRAVSGDGAGRAPEVAVRRLLVTGPLVDPLALVTSPTARISGRILLDGGGTIDPDLDLRPVAVPDPEFVPFNSRRGPTMVRGNATFEIEGLVGPTRFALLDVPDGWWLKSVDIRGVNAAEDAVTFSGADDSRADVTMIVAPTAATVAGRVTSDDGKPLDDFRVVLFPTRREQWFAGSPGIRMTGGPDGHGGYSFRSVRPDDYFLIAVDTLEGDGDSGEWQDPEVLERFALVARRVTAGERQQVTADLPLVRRGAP